MYTITGALQINQHCTFAWQEREGELTRRVELRPHHCATCIEAMRALGGERALELVDLRWTTRAGRGRILVVDDDELIRESLRGLLTDEGYAVDTARDGAEALAILRVQPGVRLIMLDLMLPVMNGWQLLDELRASRDLGRIPVCVLTATPSVPAGAADVLRKPVDAERLLDAVGRCVRA